MLNKPEVLEVVNKNKIRFEPYGDIVDTVLKTQNCGPCTDSFAQQENDDVNEVLQNYQDIEKLEDSLPDENQRRNGSPGLSSFVLMPDKDINELIHSLNYRQRVIFDMVFSWANSYVKNLSSQNTKEIQPLQLFITGGAGTGKSHLIKTIYASLTKTFSYGSMSVVKPSVLLLAPTGIAAININGNTIHSALSIPTESCGMTVPKLSDRKRCTLRMELADLKAIIIDEISMVSNTLLLYIHQRLIEIFGCVSDYNKPFAGVTVLLVGDLYQLPPVLKKPVFAQYYNELYNIYPLWRNFKMCELTEVMRQRGDATLIDILNNIRLGIVTEEDQDLLKSKIVSAADKCYPLHALHIFAENQLAKTHNLKMLEQIEGPVVTVNALDQIPDGVSNSIYEKILGLNQGNTGGLSYQLSIKAGSRVMLTSNIDIKDKVINGQIGTVVYFEKHNDHTNRTYVQFDSEEAGYSKKKADRLGIQLNAVPIDRITVDIKVNSKMMSSLIIKRTQFPLMLSWACTVHKVQGLSLNQAVVSFNLLKQRAFNHGQLYVALSRVTSLAGLFLTGQFDAKSITADSRVIAEYNYLRKNQSMIFAEQALSRCSNESFILSLCNVRSLRSHILDVKSDEALMSSDMILCTESQLSHDINADLSIDGFSLICNNSEHRFSSLAMYHKKSYCYP